MSRTEAPFDTRWAIAAKVAVPKLEKLADEAIIRAIRWRILEGKDGFAAIVAGDGPADDYDTFCADFAVKWKMPVYLLDFYDEGESIREFAAKATPKWIKRQHPAAFLRERGITAPGHEPRPRSPVRIALVVEGETPEATKKASPDKSLAFEPHPRGTIVSGDVRVTGQTLLEKRIRGPIYRVLCNPATGRFSCYVYQRGQKTRLFDPFGDRDDPQFYDYVDSILGETTLDGLLRVLAIPKEYLAS